MSAVRNRPRPPVQRPRTDHGPGPLTSTSDINGDGRSRPGTAPEQPIHVTHGLPQSVLDDVRVHVHRHGDLAVPEDLHHDAGRDADGGEERRRTVPDDAETGALGDAGERAVEVARLDGLAGAGGEDVPTLWLAGPVVMSAKINASRTGESVDHSLHRTRRARSCSRSAGIRTNRGCQAIASHPRRSVAPFKARTRPGGPEEVASSPVRPAPPWAPACAFHRDRNARDNRLVCPLVTPGGVVARTQSKCGALTQKGTRCQRLAMIGASRCDRHRGEWSSYEVQKRKAKKKRK